MVLAAGGLTVGAYSVGVNQGLASAGEDIVLEERNVFCLRLVEGFGYMLPGAEQSDRIACEVIGMSEAAAKHYIETSDRSWRIASRNGEEFALTEDYIPTRVNLKIYYHIVVGAHAG